MNTSNTIKRFGLVAFVLVATFMLGASCSKPASTANTDPRAAQVAQALSDAGVKFYGAFWCPHCDDQKQLFGDAVKKLPYIECSTPDRRSQTQVCQAEGISAYPTWEFPDKTRVEAVLSIDHLIEKANLTIPSSDQPGPITPTT